MDGCLVKLFEQMPRIEGPRLVLREMVDADAPALEELACSEAVYRYLPTFLYEQKLDDKHLVIARMREECFETRESILLAVCPADGSGQMLGIAEMYAFEERKPKVSIGYRLLERWWGRGIATEVAGMLKRYLMDETDVRTITGHVMVENVASANVLKKNGFVLLYPNCSEDWGFDEPVSVDKWVYKRRWGEDTPMEDRN